MIIEKQRFGTYVDIDRIQDKGKKGKGKIKDDKSKGKGKDNKGGEGQGNGGKTDCVNWNKEGRDKEKGEN